MVHSNFRLICDQFLQHGKTFKNFQPATIRGYRDTFSHFINSTNILDLKEFSPEMIETFLSDGRVNRNWSVCTFRTYHKRFRAFCNWLVKKKYIDSNYTDEIDKPPLERRLPKYLTVEQAEQLLETAYHLKYTYRIEHIRNRTIIGIMIFAGLRLSEIANLKRLDVDLTSGVIHVRQGKCNKDRQVPISSRLMFFLQEYVQAKPKKSHHIHFFSSVHSDDPISAHAIQRICRKLKDRSGVDFSPQILRHTFATHTYMGSRDIYAVSGLLGHAKVETTQVYAALTIEDKRHSVERHIMNGLNS